MSQHITHWFGASRSSMIRNVRERFSGLMSGFDPPDLDRADKAAPSSGAPGPLTFKFKAEFWSHHKEGLIPVVAKLEIHIFCISGTVLVTTFCQFPYLPVDRYLGTFLAFS